MVESKINETLCYYYYNYYRYREAVSGGVILLYNI